MQTATVMIQAMLRQLADSNVGGLILREEDKAIGIRKISSSSKSRRQHFDRFRGTLSYSGAKIVKTRTD